MKGLLFLSVVGLALYTLLVLTDNSLRDGEVQTAAVTQRLSSWGSDLAPTQTSQAPSAVRELTIPQNSVDEGQRFDPQQNSERNRSFGGEPKVQDSTIESGTAEWAKVVLPARVHDQASVSSLTVRHYSPGVELQVVRREGVLARSIAPGVSRAGLGSRQIPFLNCWSKLHSSRIRVDHRDPAHQGSSEIEKEEPIL